MRVEILENGDDRIVLHMEPETKKDISKLDEILNLGGQSVQGFGLNPQTRDIQHMQIIVQKNFDKKNKNINLISSHKFEPYRDDSDGGGPHCQYCHAPKLFHSTWIDELGVGPQ